MSNTLLADLHADLSSAYRRLTAIDAREARLLAALEEIKKNDEQRAEVLKSIGTLEAQIAEQKKISGDISALSSNA